VLEFCPKFGHHSRWIDRNLNPVKLVMVELPQKKKYVDDWISSVRCKYQVIYESLISSETIRNLETFDLIFCTGLLYHTVEHFKILNIVRRCLKDDGLVVFQSSILKVPRILFTI